VIPVIEKSAHSKKTPAKAAGTPGAKAPTATPPKVAPAAKPAAPPKPLTPDQRAKLEQVSKGLEMLQEDTSVPRNIRRGAEDAKKLLWDESLALDVRKSSAIGILDELANDPNIPIYGRTLIWSIMSQLEPIQ
jgi:uncharacterized protein